MKIYLNQVIMMDKFNKYNQSLFLENKNDDKLLLT